ncbi:hypothetical protein [Celeribacter litoreus]|uniref:hypothetical protein n=1 Tax=Celeribacter litoreus TaxID=2876714 RepID=UPI001CCE5D0D|nr:hypothetical protein [Celeribacter litoreus]MCA0041929.1 hypothetical protein [Celeribacter litoreus]
MSSFDRRKFLISSATFGALAGCGFTPAYGPGSAGSNLRGRVEIAAPDDRESYALANHLKLSFGEVTNPAYRLSYEIDTVERAVGITRDEEITRYHVEGEVTFALTETATGRTLTSDTVESFTSYSAPNSPVDRLTASRDAYERLMVILGDKIVDQIITTVEIV